MSAIYMKPQMTTGAKLNNNSRSEVLATTLTSPSREGEGAATGTPTVARSATIPVTAAKCSKWVSLAQILTTTSQRWVRAQLSALRALSNMLSQQWTWTDHGESRLGH